MKNPKVIIFFVMLLAFILRLAAINQSLWLDEAIGAEAIRNFTYKGLLTQFASNDNHPPLYYLILKVWTGVFGYSEASIRFPSIIFGLLSIYFTYLISRRIFRQLNLKFFYIPALFLTTSQLHIYYSQEARMYSMAAFLATGLIYCFLCLMESKLDVFRWIVFSTLLASLFVTDYLATFLLPVFWVWAIVSKKDSGWWRNFLLSHIPLLILGLLWLPTFKIQSQHGKWLLETLNAWKNLAGGANLKQILLVWVKFSLGRISFPNKPLYYLLIILFSVPFAIGFVKSLVLRKKVLFIWMWFLLPLLLVLLVSVVFPAFIFFRFIFILPAFYILLSIGILSIGDSKVRALLISIILSINIFSWTIYVSDMNQQREQWRQAVNLIESLARKDDVAIFEYPEPFTPYRWYSKGMIPAIGVTDSISANRDATYKKTQDSIQDKSGVYYFEYLRDVSDPKRYVEEVLTKESFKVKNVYSFIGVGQVYYWEKEYQ